MKRRDVLKNMGFVAGYLVATPSIISILQSCSSKKEPWVPMFLSVEQGIVLTNLSNVILPKTDIPSATELNVPQFFDKYINEVLDLDVQEQFKTAFQNIISILKTNFNENIELVSDENYKALLDTYMLVKDGIDPEREANPEFMDMTKSDFLNSVKYLCISAYLTTEDIGEHVLKYDPIPTKYYCGDLQELTGGKAWSL
tara:strand:- start:2246 stop:2842 length:597 start_codon:yes stop_codon:yes gene_type:complete